MRAWLHSLKHSQLWSDGTDQRVRERESPWVTMGCGGGVNLRDRPDPDRMTLDLHVFIYLC